MSVSVPVVLFVKCCLRIIHKCVSGDLKKPSPCSTTPECKHKCGLPEETSLLPKNMRSLSSEEQSPFVLESSFSQENIDESMNSATTHTMDLMIQKIAMSSLHSKILMCLSLIHMMILKKVFPKMMIVRKHPSKIMEWKV